MFDRWYKVFAFAALLLTLIPLRAQVSKNVLVLHMGSPQLPVNLQANKIFQGALASNEYQIFEEYLDESRFQLDNAKYAEALHRKYENQKIDLVIGWGPPALTFLLQHGEELWPTAPMVVSFLDYRHVPKLPPNMTGIVGSLDDLGPTLEFALRLLPDTEHVFYVGDAAPGKQFASGANGGQAIEILSLSKMTLGELLERLSKLPNHSVVVFGAVFKDGSGRPLFPLQICPLITSAASGPVFGSYKTLLTCGVVGGSMIDIEQPARRAAQMAIKIMHGKAVESLPIEREPPNPLLVDWRQLEKWNIPESRLPKGTAVLNRDQTLWQRNKAVILGVLSVVVAQSAIVAILIIQVIRRKRSEQASRQLSRRLLTASEDERKAIGRELHDDFGQRLSLLSLNLSLLEGQLPFDDTFDHDRFSQSRDDLDILITDVHHLSHQLHSAKLEQLGLALALKELARQASDGHSIEVKCELEFADQTLPPDVALCLYRVTQEALANALKHSGASQVLITVIQNAESLKLVVKDNGMGFRFTEKTPGLGLIAMKERLEMIGGTLSIGPRHPNGTSVVGEVRTDLQSKDKLFST